MLACFFHNRGRRRLWGLTAALLLVGGVVATAAQRPQHHVSRSFSAAAPMRSAPRWLASWAASPQVAVPGSLGWGGFDRETLREIVFPSVGGRGVRVQLVNTFGNRPLLIGRAAIGIQRAGARIAPGTNVSLSFAGRASVLIPPGATAISDPVSLSVLPLHPLAVSIFLGGPTGVATEHADAQQDTYMAPGDRALNATAAQFRAKAHSWYFLGGVEVQSARPNLGTVVAFGDSITDGVGSRLDANRRWPNDLARRLAAVRGASLAVIDEGIGGNRILHDSPVYGSDALARFHRDVIEQPAARAVILLEGINDIGFSQSAAPLAAPQSSVSADQIIAGYEQLIARARAAGVAVLGGTLIPFKGARYWSPAGEAKREQINRWIRHSGAFDGVIDFARALADPSDPERLKPSYDSGDHLHPNGVGYRAMADAVDLDKLLALARGASRLHVSRPSIETAGQK